MTKDFQGDSWALILGGSSGFGLASAKKLARHGMNLLILHRDRRGAMTRINQDFDEIRRMGGQLVSFNVDALNSESRSASLDAIAEHLAVNGRIRVLLHSIALGNLKLAAPEKTAPRKTLANLAATLNVDEEQLTSAVAELFARGADELRELVPPPQFSSTLLLEEEDFAQTIFAMGTSLMVWVQEIFRRRLFATDARVLGLTSEGNTIAWKGYAAVAAAKAALESVIRAIAAEFAPHGIRANVIQAGVSDTPALRLIPGNSQLKAEARSRNPLGRLTSPDDVANAVYLLSRDEAAWINGEIIRVDGGEHISGVRT